MYQNDPKRVLAPECRLSYCNLVTARAPQNGVGDPKFSVTLLIPKSNPNMKREEFYRGKRGAKYGIWNREKAVWQFDICEDTPFLAEARLHQKIGDDVKKWRFEARRLPDRKITLVKRVKYAGDVHSALVALGWDLDTAAAFLDRIPDAK